MFPIIKKELKSYFDHPTAYVLIVVFLIVNSFFFFRTVLVQGVADMRALFDFFPWLLLFLVPAVTMRLVAEERKVGTLEITLAQPLHPARVLLGKFVASSIFLCSALFLTLIIPIALSSAGAYDWGQIIAQYVASVLLILSLASIGICTSSFTKNQMVAFIAALGIGFFFIISGFELVTVELTGILRTVFSQMSIFAHYQNMIRGVIDVRDLIYFIAFSVSFLSLSYVFFVRTSLSARQPVYRKLKAGVAGIIAIAIMVNITGGVIPGRFDLTRQHLYTLAPATRTFLKKLNDIVTIQVYASEQLPPQIGLIERDVKDILKDFERASGGNVRIEYISVSENSDTLRNARALGIAPVQFNILKKQEFTLQQGVFGMAVLFAAEHETIPFIDNTSNLEYQLVSFIRTLTVTEKQAVAFLTGHGEKSRLSEFATFAQAVSDQYNVKEINLSLDTLDTTIAVLVIAGPTQEVSAQERTALREFINAGGSVLFLLDPILVNMQVLQGEPNEHSLSDFVAEYGVELNNDIMFDVRSNESVTFGGGFVSYILPYPFWARVPTVEQSPVSREATQVILPWASTIVPGEQAGRVELLRTTPFAGRQENVFTLGPDQELAVTQENLSPQLMAVAIAPAEDEQQNNTQSIRRGRILVVGDSDFLSEQFVRGQGSQNLIFGINAVDYLAQDETLVGIRSKNRQGAPLVFKNDNHLRFIRMGNMVGVPLLVILYALVRLLSRRRKSKNSLGDVNK